MFQVFEEEKWITFAMVLTLTLSILGRIIIWILYQNMIRETDNMSATTNKVLKKCKLKFANCYQLNGGVANVPIFVDKFMNRLTLGPMTFDGYYHLSGQMVMLSVLFSGIGVCKSIIEGRTLGELLPFYIFSFGSLYLYFSVSALTDIKAQKRVLKTNLVDYLENHMVSRLKVLPKERIAKEIMDAPLMENEAPKFGRKERQELEQLLQEFLS